MTLAPSPILPPSAPPPRALAAEHWQAILLAHFELVRAEIRAELTNDHPGARHRVARLLSVAANIDGQIQAAGATP